MSGVTVFFLVVITLGLALLLSFLGWVTLHSNLLGWFLLITGLIYFFGVILVYWIRGIRFWQPRAGGQIVKEEQDDGSFWAIVVGIIAAFYVPPIEYIYFKVILFKSIWVEIMGWMLILLGSILFIWARRVLGRFYSGHIVVIDGQPLIQNGPYRYIRHPAYLGYLLIALGVAVGYISVTGLLLIPFLLIPTVVYRLSVEDKLLAEYFGDQFKVYAGKTARLIPSVW